MTAKSAGIDSDVDARGVTIAPLLAAPGTTAVSENRALRIFLEASHHGTCCGCRAGAARRGIRRDRRTRAVRADTVLRRAEPGRLRELEARKSRDRVGRPERRRRDHHGI